MTRDRLKEIVPPLCTAVFMLACAVGAVLVYDRLIRKVGGVFSDRRGYTMWAFLAGLLSLSLFLHAAIAAMNSGKSFRTYLKPSAILHGGLVLPGALLCAPVLLGGPGSIIAFALVIGSFGWLGARPLQSRLSATARGPRSRAWAVATAASAGMSGLGAFGLIVTMGFSYL